jgi:glycosyltransferase involved in cell wall biosynthesis
VKVALYAHARHPGGLLDSLGRLARGLTEAGDQVSVLVHPDPGAQATAAAAHAAGARVFRIRIRGGRDLKGLVRFRRTLRRLRPDVVHLHLSAPAESTAALAVARTVGAGAVLVTQHAPGWWPRRGPLRSLSFRLSGLLARRSAAVCRSDRRRLCEEMGLPEGKVVVVPPVPAEPAALLPSGSLRSLLGLPEGVPLIGTHGAVDLSKGSDLLLTAASRSRHPEARWVVLGDGPLLPELQEEAGSRGRVIFAGWHRDAARLLGDLDVYVMPSRTEGLPQALLEALQARLPVVATRVGGIPELLGSEGGVIVPPGSSEALAAAVDDLLDDAEARRRLSEAAPAVAAGYRAPEVVRAHRSLYRALAGERSR